MGRRHMQSVDEGPLPLPVPLVAQPMEQRATDASSPHESVDKKKHNAIRRLGRVSTFGRVPVRWALALAAGPAGSRNARPRG
jgi:hypothetical protein